MTAQTETLLSLAEVAVALAGFAAIVVVLKRGSGGRWRAADADQFHGMIIHSIAAVIFCLLPFVVDVMVQDAVTTIRLCAAALGVQMLVHAFAVMFFSTSGVWARASLSLGVLLGLTQFAVFADWGAQREFVIYTVGIVWHIAQSGLLFVLLVWISADNIEPED